MCIVYFALLVDIISEETRATRELEINRLFEFLCGCHLAKKILVGFVLHPLPPPPPQETTVQVGGQGKAWTNDEKGS